MGESGRNGLGGLTLASAGALLRRREISSAELTGACLERIAAVEPLVRSFITLTPELARRQAAQADRILAAGEGGPLTGVPAQLKDVLCTEGVTTTCASRMLANYVPVYDATATARLFGQGAVMLGKGNMDEFAMGSSCENSAFHPTHNPWDLGRVPGGSSGGAAAAVASGQALYALGSDTGGSVRQPAALCGLVGLKPSYGRVSRYGLVAYASSLDQVGPIARTAEDCALILSAIAGQDARDATSLPLPAEDFAAGLDEAAAEGLAGLRAGRAGRVFRRRAGGRSAGGGGTGHRDAGRAGGADSGNFAALHQVRPGLLLHSGALGMFGLTWPAMTA